MYSHSYKFVDVRVFASKFLTIISGRRVCVSGTPYFPCLPLGACVIQTRRPEMKGLHSPTKARTSTNLRVTALLPGTPVYKNLLLAAMLVYIYFYM